MTEIADDAANKIHEPKVEKFEVGNVVQLRSGGPGMTVVVVAGDDITCSWFVQLSSTAYINNVPNELWANDYESGTFPKDALALVRRL